MEIEVEGRVKPLAYKVKAMSRESPSQKASHVLDADLRSHWSTSTNTKEWILLELNVRTNYSHTHTLSLYSSLSLSRLWTNFNSNLLQEPCLLSHIRIHNKSVLEWEISVGLRFKVRFPFLLYSLGQIFSLSDFHFFFFGNSRRRS